MQDVAENNKDKNLKARARSNARGNLENFPGVGLEKIKFTDEGLRID